ncbi:MAG TPA: hypothetical protein VGO62_12525 [Myxococcota bacterium]|jgi:hypothetical protein
MTPEQQPSSSSADASRAPPQPRAMPELRIERLADLDAVSARHYVDAYVATRAIRAKLGALLGVALAVGAMVGPHIDTLRGGALFAAACALVVASVATIIIRRVQRDRAADAAGLAFPIDRELDAISGARSPDALLAVLMERVRSGAPAPLRVARAQWRTLTTWIVFIGLVIGMWSLFGTHVEHAPGDSQSRAAMRTMTPAQLRATGALWVTRAAHGFVPRSLEKAGLVDDAATMRAINLPASTKDAAELVRTLREISESAREHEHIKEATEVIAVELGVSYLQQTEFNEGDLAALSRVLLNAANSEGQPVSSVERRAQLEDLGVPATR